MHDWTAAAALTNIRVSGTKYAMTYWARAIGSAHLHKPEDVRKDIAEIEHTHDAMVKSKKPQFAEAGGSGPQTSPGWLAFSQGKYDDAVEALRPIADKEDTVGNQPDGIPTREMIADILLEAKRAAAGIGRISN